jgi:hypothetical protein
MINYESLTERQLLLVVLHELGHVKSMLENKRNGDLKEVWNLAEDLVRSPFLENKT